MRKKSMIQQPQNRKQKKFFSIILTFFQQKSLYFSLKNFASNLDF